jgi:dihydroflavonol-4-reductase
MLGCEAVIHLACLSAWDEIESPALEPVVVDGTRNIIAAAANRVRMVYVSSLTAVGATDRPSLLSETAPYNLSAEPGLAYAHAKHRAELLCRQAAAQGADVVVVNPAETYGPEDVRLVTAGNLIDFAKGPLTLVCRGGTCLAHVDDVAAGIVAAMERGRAGERYILGGDNLSHRSLARLVLEIAGRRQPILTVPNTFLRVVTRLARALRIPLPFHPNVVPYATRYWFADNSKAVRELNIHFRSARETLEPTIDWLRAAGHIR